MTDLSGLLRAVGLGVLLGIGVRLLGPLLGFTMHTAPTLLTAILVCVVGWFAYECSESGDAPSWPRPPIPQEVPSLPRELRVRRLQPEIQGALDRTPVASRNLCHHLADAVADRLVARHGADPAHPLRDVGRFVSPGFATYLAAAELPDTQPPRLNRPTLHAYLKEIDAL